MSRGDGEEASRRGGVGGEDEQQSARRVRRPRHPLALPFIKSGKRGSNIPPPPPPPPRPSVNDLGKGCYPCFLRPSGPPNPASGRSPGGPSGSRPPNYYEFLKSMIEQNDFYSPECNIHRDGR